MEACPQGAISKDAESELVTIDYELCNGCRECMDACPFKANFWDESAGKVIKCDTCLGDPRCVDACKFEVLVYE
jgi:Fe-S-cluster-containing dehydrogenase component